jgi:hypothetical protein
LFPDPRRVIAGGQLPNPDILKVITITSDIWREHENEPVILVNAYVGNRRHANPPSRVQSSKSLIDEDIELDLAMYKEIILIRRGREGDILHAADDNQVVTAIANG